jgi:serine/threonine protein phosphatase PrpC
MSHEILCFSLPKIGELERNIQDRFENSPDRSLVALSDGASSSLYPQKWAEILVKSFCRSAAENPIEKMLRSHEEWLQPSQEIWRQYYLTKLQSPSRKWWQGGSEIKNRGSATFLGLQLQNLQPLEKSQLEKSQWQAVAVGDTCLFKLERETCNLLTFPLTTAQEFKGTTPCFESLPEYPSFSPQFTTGCYDSGDIFLLATDALSQWILTDYEAQGQEWKKMFTLQNQHDFASFVNELRQQKLIKNDDTTLVLIRVSSE